MSSPVVQVRSRIPRIAEGAVERARLTVVPRRHAHAARMPFVALVSLVLLGGVVGLLLFNTSMQQSSFAATALESRADTLASRQQALEMEIERLRNPQRIATAAQDLGMVQAGNPAFLELGTGEVSGIPSAGDPDVRFPIWPAPPVKPAELDPEPNVVLVEPPAPASDAGVSGESGDTGGQAAGGPVRGDKKNQQ